MSGRGRMSRGEILVTIGVALLAIGLLLARERVVTRREPGTHVLALRIENDANGGLSAAVLDAGAVTKTGPAVEVALHVQARPGSRKSAPLYRTDEVRMQVHGYSDEAARMRDRAAPGAALAAIGRAVALHEKDDVWIEAAANEGRWITGRYLKDLYFSPCVIVPAIFGGFMLWGLWRWRRLKHEVDRIIEEQDGPRRYAENDRKFE